MYGINNNINKYFIQAKANVVRLYAMKVIRGTHF
jgi:hypothetical protein